METKYTYFAGGCFWCIEHDFSEAEGVLESISGYMGEKGSNPTYLNHEGFREAVKIKYDSEKTNFKKLVQFFLDHIDPTDPSGQFHDRGESYKTAIYYENEIEKNVALTLLEELDESRVYDRPSAVDVLPSLSFFPAEDYHQKYAEKNPEAYARYRKGSGRGDFVARTCAVREEKNINWKD